MPRDNTLRAERIPKAAKVWTLWRVTTTTRRNKETGRNYKANVTQRMTGDADADGTVADQWPVAEFSVKAIRERWGAGRFRVDWYDNKAQKLGDWKFDVAEPSPRAAAAPAAEDEDGDSDAMLARLPQTQMGWIMWTQAREERAERRREQAAREERARMQHEADERATRDRDFLREVAGVNARTAAAAPATAAPDMTREFALMRRELSLTMREQVLQMRAEFQNAQAVAAANADTEDRPETAKDALNSAGVEMIETIGEGLADIGPDLLGAVRKWLRSKGFADTPSNLQALVEQAAEEVAALNGQTNGAAAEAE
jgi:hypothetical protein